MRVETRRAEGYDLMEYYGEVTGATGASSFQDPSGEWRHHLQHADSGLEAAVWQLNLQEGDEMEEQHLSSQYPERPGQADCDYYMRTGMCSFGISCRYNHPPNWKLAAAIARSRGEHPERPGQAECQYFLKTGTCKFGSTCKYHHPRDKPGLAARVQLNVIGYPLRPGEKECAYYMRTGACKYGITCKFHHPQPTPVSPLMPGSPLYSPASPSAAHQPYGWPLRSPYLLSPRLSPSGYQSVPMLVPPPQAGMVSVPSGWPSYQQGPVSPLASPEAGGAGLLYSPHGDNPVHHSASKDSFYPERPGQADCMHYLRTGDCKFGPACRYHHPKDNKPVVQQQGSFTFTNQSLPQRPGAPTCTYYARNGLCKFGSACRYDHPVGNIAYSPSTSSLADMPVAPYPTASSPPSSSASEAKQASIAPEEQNEEIVLGSVAGHDGGAGGGAA